MKPDDDERQDPADPEDERLRGLRFWAARGDPVAAAELRRLERDDRPAREPALEITPLVI